MIRALGMLMSSVSFSTRSFFPIHRALPVTIIHHRRVNDVHDTGRLRRENRAACETCHIEEYATTPKPAHPPLVLRKGRRRSAEERDIYTKATGSCNICSMADMGMLFCCVKVNT